MERIQAKHLRPAINAGKACLPQARAIIERHGYTWKQFLREGILISELRKLDDAVIDEVLDIVENTYGRR
jgi:hypothetical protein